MPQLTLDLRAGRLIKSRGDTSLLEDMALQRSAGETLYLTLIEEGAVTELTGSPEFRFILKLAMINGSEALTTSENLAHSGTFYKGIINLITSAINELLSIGEEGEHDTVAVFGQLSWRTAAEAPWQHSQVIDIAIDNSIHNGGEEPVASVGMRTEVDEGVEYMVITTADGKVRRIQLEFVSDPD